jgi:signal transduction histidine kinase/CheY-like chemotaxis protein
MIGKRRNLRCKSYIIDEIEELGRSFNRMTDSLRERDDVLKSKNEALQRAKEELEEKVQERTAALSLSNKKLQKEMRERQRMEDELIRAQKLDSLGVLAGGIAHDFNNILTAILGNISLTKMKIDMESKVSTFLSEAEKASLRAQNLTQQLLTFSKGGVPIKELVSIGKIIKESVDFSLQGSNVRSEYRIPEKLWPVEADKGQISQIMNNLVINAKQAMPDGGTIHVAVENVQVGSCDFRTLSEGRYVKITIEDHGLGIREDLIPRIFDPYFTTKKKGSGLGLAISYAIIKKHNGNIFVDSSPGEGTIFSIFLPASNEAIHTEDEKEEVSILGSGRILVMDDESEVRMVLGNMLETLGYSIEFAEHGEEAVELYRKAKRSGKAFEACILDLTVPGGLGGKETILKLRRIDPKVKGIVSSGYSNDPVMSKYREYGFSGVIKKPYRLYDLSRVINNVMMCDASTDVDANQQRNSLRQTRQNR